jgi:glutamate-1-semialdehyde 2,1-aminomutase/spore coat polysaccharide biosynthesis protein SpsF
MKILALIQARMSSRRLPGKILAPILGKPMLLRQVERVRRSRTIDKIVVVTSDHRDDDAVERLCAENEIDCFRGSLDDVLDRFYRAALPFKPDHVVRLTGDCPLTDPGLIDEVVESHLRTGADFTNNALEPTFPDGLDVEVVRFESLAAAWREASALPDREHVTPFIEARPARFKTNSFKNGVDFSAMRWTVDEPEDLVFVRQVYGALLDRKADFDRHDVLALLERDPSLLEINRKFERNEGLRMSQRKEWFSNRYRKSMQLLERAEKTIPLGSQTFSKSRTQFPYGVSPYFVTRAQGSRVWDVDGNEYIDFINALCSVTLGHVDPDVTTAVRAQLEQGVIFSLPHTIEAEVAELICAMVPCAQSVRFGKNGSDATAGAIRVARAFTGRDHVAVCGYHGWQDWYIGSTARNRGVPQATRDLTHIFAYNDLGSLRKLLDQRPGGFAAVILEPMNVAEPAPGFLQGVKDLVHRHGALLVFDETITGFRYANGGAQELFGVVPDLATFGKGLANGYPVSALAGRRDVMKLMEEIFFSFTFGGETLSLAAARATLLKLRTHDVVGSIRARGTQLITGVRALIEQHGLGSVLAIAGHPSWSFLTIKDTPQSTSWATKTLFMQEIMERGILSFGTHNISYAHTEADIARLLAVYDEVFPLLRAGALEGRLNELLRCRPLEPLFKVR